MSKKTKRSRNELSCIAVGKYYDALDMLRYAGDDEDESSAWQRDRASKLEGKMREAVKEFEETYGSSRAGYYFPSNVWQAAHQPLNVWEFDRAWRNELLKTIASA